MFDTIEHLKSPDVYLKKIYTFLKPGGIIVIETGDIGSWLAKIQGGKWRLITPPTHLNYFSNDTLAEILKRDHFQVLEKCYVPFHRTLRQTIFRFTRNKKFLDLFNKLLKTTFAVNTYDLLFVIARKADESNY